MAVSKAVSTYKRILSVPIGHCSKFAIETHYESSQFLKVVIPFTISTLLYRRCNMDDNHIKKFVIEDEPYYTFHANLPETHYLHKLHSSTRLLKKLIEQKHIKQISINIVKNNDGTVCESFIFTIKYKSNDIRETCIHEDITRQIANMFAAINSIPDQNKYNEDEITITFGWKFFDTIPLSVLEEQFDEVHFDHILNHLNFRLVHIGSLKTKHHRVDLMLPQPRRLATRKAAITLKKTSIIQTLFDSSKIDSGEAILNSTVLSRHESNESDQNCKERELQIQIARTSRRKRKYV